jgi:hypothetical protein
MYIYKNTTTAFKLGLGSTRTGYTVSWRTRDSNGDEVTTWSETGVVELGYGNYGLMTSFSTEQSLYLEWRAVKAGATTLYLVDPITVVSNITSDLTTIKQIGIGRWKIDSNTNQMVLYDSDDTTPLVTFDLKDSDGNASSTIVYERTPA